jgi:hypothetical protein
VVAAIFVALSTEEEDTCREDLYEHDQHSPLILLHYILCTLELSVGVGVVVN